MTVTVHNAPAGLGNPVFDKLDAELSKAIMSIGAVKAVEIGCGINASKMTGSEYNDERTSENGNVIKLTNHAGGIEGGISDGSDIIIKAHIKPTPSINIPQRTITKDFENTEIKIEGRHDPCIAPKAAIAAEAMTAITIADALLQNASAKLSSLKKIYY